LDLKFHEANAVHQIEPAAFFMKYHYLERLLNEHGFKIYRSNNRSEKLDDKTLELISSYNRYLEEHLPTNRWKGFNTVKHDIIVWQATKKLRKSGTSGLDVGALFLSADQRLFAYDWGVLSSGDRLGVVVLPSQLLQLLRPFVPRTQDFDQKFADIFALPEFRSGAADFSQITRRVLGFLATVKDLKEETAAAILADEVLLRRLKAVETDEGVKDFIESEILKKNEALATKHRETTAELEIARHEVARKQSMLEESQREAAENMRIASERLADLEEERVAKERSVATAKSAEVVSTEAQSKLITVQEEKARLGERLKESDKQVSELQRTVLQMNNSIDRKLKIMRVIGGFLFLIIGWAVIFALPAIRNWQWLQSNNHRVSLYLAGLILVAGSSWAIFSWKHRLWALSAVIFAVIIRLIGVL
jgi:membrane-associated HD superfamily phosphohydrolase